MNLNNLATTNRLLALIALPIVLYSVKLLSFILTPLLFAFFISLLFVPMLRWFHKHAWSKYLSLSIVLLIFIATALAVFMLIRLTGAEVLDGKDALFERLDQKVGSLLLPYAEMLKIDLETKKSAIEGILSSTQFSEMIYGNFGTTLMFLQKTIVMFLMTLFFLVLLLAGTVNFKTIMQGAGATHRTKWIKIYLAVEKSIVKFLKVKFLMSFFTGLGFGIVAWSLGISFPLFWGLFAFAINFVQMIGSVIATVLATLFAFIELEQPGTIFLAAMLFTGVQVVFGSVLEPILMGKSFSINVITVLVMLMFWGYLWGVPGLILSIPITVMLKAVMEQTEGTRTLAKLMA